MWRTLVWLMLLAGSTFGANPQPLSESRIKAGFLLNFTRFVEWPASAFATPASPFLVCVIGAAPVAELLAAASVGKTVGDRALTIKTMKSSDDLHLCQVLYLGASIGRQMPRLLDSVKTSSVLTVSEVPGFAEAGGMIGFAVEDNRVKLELNLEAATRTGLKVSSKLIAVSRLVAHNSALSQN